MPPPGPGDAVYVEAYWLACEGWALSEIVAYFAHLPKPPGGTTTANDWVQKGMEIEAANGGPTRRRKAQRDMAAAALNRLRTQMAAEMRGKRWEPERAVYYDTHRKLIMDRVKLLGLAAAPAAVRSRLKVDGIPSGSPLPPKVAEGLAAWAQSGPLLPIDDEDDEAAG